MTLTYEMLSNSVKEDAAIRRVQRLQPVGGDGDKIFPSTYPDERDNGPARHLFETRRLGGQEVKCVVIDSVQSQANRLEEALLELVHTNKINIPHVFVDFNNQNYDSIDISDLGKITSLEAPHRIFDAIIRDSMLGEKKFTETNHYEKLVKAKPSHSLDIFNICPSSLVFGSWNSTGDSGGLGSKFTRIIVSEIVGINAVEGKKADIRIDPLSIPSTIQIVGNSLNWHVAAPKEAKSVKPSKINHSNIIPKHKEFTPGGVSVDYAQHTAVISCAGLRRLRFPPLKDDNAGQTVLAALALVALVHQDKSGYALRSRCDLVCEGKANFEIVCTDGTTQVVEIEEETALGVLKNAIEKAKSAGFTWNIEPMHLKPQPRLVQLVAMSRVRGLAEVSEESQTE